MLHPDTVNSLIKSNILHVESSLYASIMKRKNGTINARDKPPSEKNVLAMAAFNSKTVDEGLQKVQETLTYELLIHGSAIKNNLKMIINKSKEMQGYKSKYSKHMFSLPLRHQPKFNDWFYNDFVRRHDPVDPIDRTRCLFVIGPTLCGKTSFARAIEPMHMFFRCEFSIELWNDNAKLIIVDDIKWVDIEKYAKSLLTSYGTITLTDKYKPKRTVENNKPAIYLMNGDDAGNIDKNP
ncbi:unnamed protein product, partial [Didymodactylos carnosus]